MLEIITSSQEETEALGRRLAKDCLQKEGTVFLALEGDLGSGKTTFLQGLGEGLGVKDYVTSPTFVIYKKYQGERGRVLYHFDAYRITEKDLEVLNFNEVVSGENNIVAVEWSENIKESLPEKKIKISFSVTEENKRRLIVSDNNDIIRGELRDS